MVDSTNLVPLGQANTGSAVVLQESQAPKALARFGPMIAQAAQFQQRLDWRNRQLDEMQKARLLRDSARDITTEGKPWLPHQEYFLNAQNQQIGSVAKLYQDGTAYTPAGRAAIAMGNARLKSIANQSDQIRRVYDDVSNYFEANSKGPNPILDGDKAMASLNAIIYDANGRPRKPEEIDLKEFEKLRNNPELYNDAPVFGELAKSVKDDQIKIKEAGTIGGKNLVLEFASKGPYKRDANGAPIFVDGQGRVVDASLPNATPLVDFGQLYELASQAPIAKNKIDSQAVQVYNQLTGAKLTEVPQDMAKVDQAKWQQATELSTQKYLEPYLDQKVSRMESLNAQPRKVGGSGNNETDDDDYQVNLDAPIRVGDMDMKTVRVTINPQNTTSTGDTRAIVGAGDILVDTKNNRIFKNTQQYEGVTGSYDIALEAQKDFYYNGKLKKKGTYIFAGGASEGGIKEIYTRYQNELRPVWMQLISRKLPKEDYVEFQIGDKGAVDPMTGERYQANTVIQLERNSPKYQAIKQSGGDAFTEISQRAGRSTDPETVYRPAAYLNVNTNTLETGKRTSGFISKKLRRKLEKTSNEAFGGIRVKLPSRISTKKPADALQQKAANLGLN